ncbi:hypothetical protein [Actinoplanes sp. N902-109]|uniref:hypothetical protein n=1 Tax=Actinoplanes sp. (strain N902-109) TaxID=649831 RepID=UPI0003293697|nr:hypothetical protein [Actinoplanes sp. N902-109]AGL17561.1 hypothetical protein L083_4051 [Actinoplanes sp. N902-109]
MNAEEADRPVSIPLDAAIRTARLLESIVISLDRIGSQAADGEADADTLDQFVTEWLVGPRLSRARSVLWGAITEVIGEERTEAIAASTPCFPDPVPEEVHTLREELETWNATQPGDA